MLIKGIFEKRYKELEKAIHDAAALKKQLTHENHDLDVRIKLYEQERTNFEEERAEWKEELERSKLEIIEQNDRLTVLSERLSGTKVCNKTHVHTEVTCIVTCMYSQNELEAKKSELASQRIAFEEEKLAKLDEKGTIPDSEAEALRIKLKQQVIINTGTTTYIIV